MRLAPCRTIQAYPLTLVSSAAVSFFVYRALTNDAGARRLRDQARHHKKSIEQQQRPIPTYVFFSPFWLFALASSFSSWIVGATMLTSSGCHHRATPLSVPATPQATADQHKARHASFDNGRWSRDYWQEEEDEVVRFRATM
jgi:hypothetical protein